MTARVRDSSALPPPASPAAKPAVEEGCCQKVWRWLTCCTCTKIDQDSMAAQSLALAKAQQYVQVAPKPAVEVLASTGAFTIRLERAPDQTSGPHGSPSDKAMLTVPETKKKDAARKSPKLAVRILGSN